MGGKEAINWPFPLFQACVTQWRQRFKVLKSWQETLYKGNWKCLTMESLILDTRRNFEFSVVETKRKNFSTTCVYALLILRYFVMLVIWRAWESIRLILAVGEWALALHSERMAFLRCLIWGFFSLLVRVQGVRLFIVPSKELGQGGSGLSLHSTPEARVGSRKSNLAPVGELKTDVTLLWNLINTIDCLRSDVQFSSGYRNETFFGWPGILPCQRAHWNLYFAICRKWQEVCENLESSNRI